MTNFAPEFPQYRTVRRWMEDGQDLCRLLLAEESAAAMYLALARQLGGRAGGRLEQMAREAQAHAACLEGICVLVTGTVPELCPAPPEHGEPQVLLRRCYGRAMRTLVTYEARREDAEYGPVFSRLAAQQQEHCRIILEILGTLHQS